MQEISYKDLKFNPFNLIGDEWMLVTAGNKQSGCNTMTASWGHLMYVGKIEKVLVRDDEDLKGHKQ